MKKKPTKTYSGKRITFDLPEEDYDFLVDEAKAVGDKIGVSHVLRALVKASRLTANNQKE